MNIKELIKRAVYGPPVETCVCEPVIEVKCAEGKKLGEVLIAVAKKADEDSRGAPVVYATAEKAMQKIADAAVKGHTHAFYDIPDGSLTSTQVEAVLDKIREQGITATQDRHRYRYEGPYFYISMSIN